MSVFRPATFECPSCGKSIQFEVSHSINADRRPDIRDAILDGSFQRGTCDHCQHGFRLDPELTYLDVGRKQWIFVQPVAKLVRWPELEVSARENFDRAYGASAPAAAKEIGRGLQVRAVFGWAAFREKIYAAEVGLDDITLELLKVAILRTQDNQPIGDDHEMRLLESTKSELVIGWIDANSERVLETIKAPRKLYDEIAVDKQGWEPLRQELSAGPFVDLHRILVPAE